MNQFILGMHLFLQSISFTFKHAKLLLYFFIFSLGNLLLSYYLFPSLTITAQTIQNNFIVEGNYHAGIISSPSLFAILSILYILASVFIYTVLRVAVTDHAFHLIHNRKESIWQGLHKGLSQTPSLIMYLAIRTCLILLLLYIPYLVLKPKISLITLLDILLQKKIDSSIESLIFIGTLGLVTAKLLWESLTFYFFPALIIDNSSFFTSLVQSIKTMIKTIGAIIGALIIIISIDSMIALAMPENSPLFLTTALDNIMNIISITVLIVFQTMLYEKMKGSLPKKYDPSR